MPIIKIISGGQTGADRAALDAAIQKAMPAHWYPRNTPVLGIRGDSPMGFRERH